ncbi:MAG: hypothetical protein AAF922_02720, partial [Pseudomonadota bacterium]
MADFHNITGWMEELQAYRVTDEHKALVPKDAIERAKNPPMKIPVAWVVELVHLIVRHQELREAYTEFGRWILANHYDEDGNRVSLDDGLPEDFPNAASEVARWFVHWFVYIGKKPGRFVHRMSGLVVPVSEILVRHGETTTVADVVSEIIRLKATS